MTSTTGRTTSLCLGGWILGAMLVRAAKAAEDAVPVPFCIILTKGGRPVRGDRVMRTDDI